MSYQFAFWRTTSHLDAGTVFSRISRGDDPIEGLETLDVGAIETALGAAFPELVREGSLVGGGHMDFSGEIGSIDVESTSQSVTCTCYGMDEDGWNRLIDVFIALRLPLFDPQTNERFASASVRRGVRIRRSVVEPRLNV